MSELQIITNHANRPFKYGYEIPKKVRKQDYNHLTEDETEDGWIHYRGSYYHISDFMRLGDNHPFSDQWNGYISDSYFSGILINISEDGEFYRIATYLA